MRQSRRNHFVSEVDMPACVNATCTIGQATRLFLDVGSYQGISFFNPFFLLLDSFWLLSLFAWVELLLSVAVPLVA